MFKRTIAALTILVAVLCLAVKVDAAKSDKWLIYWYVCGTDIETTRIAFGSGTDLMSDDPKALILAEPDRAPGDATRSIKEVEVAELSPNVKIFIQAGGTYIWGHEKFRDLNAKIQTKLEVILSDGNGNPLKATDENGNPIKDEYGNDKYQTLYSEAISKLGINVDRWYLDEYVTDENGEYVTDKEGNRIQNFVPVENGQLGRYIYDKDHRNWHAREILPIPSDPTNGAGTETDMGSKTGFKDFLQAGQELERSLYPDGNVRRVLILKDHGDGTNICSDEYTKNIIPVEVMKEAFVEVQGDWANPDEKPFELVVFDACLMSTYETAIALENAANYMVASQETTFDKGNMSYTALLNELSKNPSMSGKEFGKIICNTGWKDSKVVDKEFRKNTNAVFTMSVIDLSEQKMDALKAAYANFSEEATKVVQENLGDIATLVKFKNAANIAERYPSNLDVSEQATMDLKNFSGNLEATLPELKEAGHDLVKALDNSVVYNKRGDVLNRGGGLSSAQFLTGFYRTLQNNIQGISVDLSGLKDEIVEIDSEKKTAKIELSEEDLANVESVRYQLIYAIPRNDGSEKMDAMLLGSDSDVEENRETGTVTISLNSQKWVMLDGKPLLVQVTSDATHKGKNGKKVSGNDICVSPILLNGEACRLFFSRSYPNGKVTLIGVVPIPQNDKTPLASLPSGELKSLKKGDVVTPLYIYSKDEKAGYVSGIPITIGDKPKLEMSTLSDGIFGYVFEFVNPVDNSKNVFTRDGAIIKIKKGKIVKAIPATDFESPGDLED